MVDVQLTKIKERILREQIVKEITGLSRITRWRWAKTGKFPRPIKLGDRKNGWLESDIQKWIESHRGVV